MQMLDETIVPSSPRKKTRQRLLCSSTGASSNPDKKHVLPNECLICQSRKYVTGASCARNKAKLVCCSTKNADTLKKAAKLHQNQRILTQLQDKDMVAIEAKIPPPVLCKLYYDQNSQ